MTTDDQIWALHEEANNHGRDSYRDPRTGYHVFTEHGLRRRGRCCGSGCRHCPFAHQQTPLDRRAAVAQVPAWLTVPPQHDEPVDVLFWSGGKDSFLTWRKLVHGEAAADRRRVVLLTTFDALERRVAHQEVRLDHIVRQAVVLQAPLIGVPLHPGRDYLERVAAGLRLLPHVRRLAFGDLHLEHIRQWREFAFAALLDDLNAELVFPLWHADYGVLLKDLAASGVSCVISARDADRVPEVAVGERFDPALLARLPPEVDPFGERGEFHTLARVWEG